MSVWVSEFELSLCMAFLLMSQGCTSVSILSSLYFQSLSWCHQGIMNSQGMRFNLIIGKSAFWVTYWRTALSINGTSASLLLAPGSYAVSHGKRFDCGKNSYDCQSLVFSVFLLSRHLHASITFFAFRWGRRCHCLTFPTVLSATCNL